MPPLRDSRNPSPLVPSSSKMILTPSLLSRWIPWMLESGQSYLNIHPWITSCIPVLSFPISSRLLREITMWGTESCWQSRWCWRSGGNDWRGWNILFWFGLIKRTSSIFDLPKDFTHTKPGGLFFYSIQLYLILPSWR